MNIYSHISSNKQKTYFLIFGFIVFVSLLMFAVGELYLEQFSGIFIGVLGFCFSAVSAVFSYYYSDRIVLSMSKAKKADRESFSKLYGILENLCIGAGLKHIPDLYIIDDDALNAFATGRDPEHSSIALTKGLVEKLSKREVEGVMAHELSHIKNYDIRLMTVIVVLVGTVAIISDITIRSMFYGRSRDRKSGVSVLILIVGILLIVLSPIIANIIKFAVSRKREFLADASASLITRDPVGLADALEVIASDRHHLKSANNATAHLYISNPLNKTGIKGWFTNLFNTHPPVEERIQRLRHM